MSLLNNIFSKNRIAIELTLRDTIDYVVSQFKQDRQQFTVASAYGQIIFVLENIAQLILYYIEDSITELNINTATRANSVYGLAALAGHDPTRAISATGQIGVMPINAGANQVPGGAVVIPNFTQINLQNNGKVYLLDLPSDSITIPLDGSVSNLNFNTIQGTVETQTFTGNGGPIQSYNVNTGVGSLVENFHVSVYVNGTLWQQYDSLTDIPYNGMGYIVRTNISGGGINVFFGNTYFGAQPPLGSQIVCEYLVSAGEPGNLLVQPGETVTYNWVDTGLSIYGDEVDLNQVLSISSNIAPYFGSNPEPLALTRLIAPKTSRSYVLATIDSFIVYLEKFNFFSIINAWTSQVQNVNDQNVVYLFLIPDISKLLLTNQNYFNVPETEFTLDDQQKSQFLTLIANSGSQMVTTDVTIVDPTISRYVLNVALILFQGFSPTTVQQEILNKLSNYFVQIRRTDMIPRSDLISIIDSVDGVDSISMSIISEMDEQAFIANPALFVPKQINQFGDIIIQQGQLPIIRGGWTDRNGIAYAESLTNNGSPGAVNIIVEGTVVQNYNTAYNQMILNNIKNQQFNPNSTNPNAPQIVPNSVTTGQ